MRMYNVISLASGKHKTQNTAMEMPLKEIASTCYGFDQTAHTDSPKSDSSSANM